MAEIAGVLSFDRRGFFHVTTLEQALCNEDSEYWRAAILDEILWSKLLF